ncbi:hypothetical protein GGF42_005030 [Coemansia sp. RSA 2424]|nr:hypothetical protein GGF42_005030 [Coemansia sp. RSA 2424]
MVTLTIKCLGKELRDLTVGDLQTTKVLELKTLIAEKLADTPVTSQRLIFAGRILKDDDTLGSYNVVEGSTVHLINGVPSKSVNPQATRGASMTDGSVNPPTAPLTSQQQMLAQLAENPELLRMVLESSPMLKYQQITPQMREMLANPEFLRMATNPDMTSATAQMQAAMQHMPSGLSQSPPPFNSPFNPFGAAAANQANPANATASQQAPPEERLQQQQQLNDMGSRGSEVGQDHKSVSE